MDSRYWDFASVLVVAPRFWFCSEILRMLDSVWPLRSVEFLCGSAPSCLMQIGMCVLVRDGIFRVMCRIVGCGEGDECGFVASTLRRLRSL